MQSINPGVVHKNFTSKMNALFFLVSYHEKAALEKANSFIGRVPYHLKKYILHSALGPRGYYKFWLSENNTNDAEVKHKCARQYYSTSSICTKPWRSSTAYGNFLKQLSYLGLSWLCRKVQ